MCAFTNFLIKRKAKKNTKPVLELDVSGLSYIFPTFVYSNSISKLLPLNFSRSQYNEKRSPLLSCPQQKQLPLIRTFQIEKYSVEKMGALSETNPPGTNYIYHRLEIPVTPGQLPLVSGGDFCLIRRPSKVQCQNYPLGT